MGRVSCAARFGVGMGLSVLLVLSACSDGPENAEDPEQERIAFRDDLRGYYEHLAQCLTDLGFPSEVYPSGDGLRGTGNPMSGGVFDAEAYAAASATCDEQAGPHPEIPAVNAEDVEKYYDRLVEVGECLEENGFPSTPPMSREAYVETYLASLSGRGSPPMWSPYIDEPGAEERAACPEPIFADIYYGDR